MTRKDYIPLVATDISVSNTAGIIDQAFKNARSPTRKTKLWQVRYGGEVLWLHKNRNTWKTKGAAKQAAIVWLKSQVLNAFWGTAGWTHKQVATQLTGKEYARSDHSEYTDIHNHIIVLVNRAIDAGLLSITEVRVS